jgi:hypothetical protein
MIQHGQRTLTKVQEEQKEPLCVASPVKFLDLHEFIPEGNRVNPVLSLFCFLFFWVEVAVQWRYTVQFKSIHQSLSKNKKSCEVR